MSEPYIRPDVAAFLNILNNQPGPAMEELPIEQARQRMAMMRHMVDVPVGELGRLETLSIPGPAGEIAARLYDTRNSRDPSLVMVYYHGGGFVLGDLDTHEPYCAEAARILDMPVISIAYRLAPEAIFPAGPEDCEAATRWVAENIPCTGLVLSGDSAGGNLTIVTAMALRDRPAAVPVVAQYPMYPGTSASRDWQSYRDFKNGYFLDEGSIELFGKLYQRQDNDYRASPLDFDQTGMPPSLVVTAGLDPLRDQGKAYADRLKAEGVPVVYKCAEGLIHGYVNLRKAIPSVQRDIEENLAELKNIIAEATATA